MANFCDFFLALNSAAPPPERCLFLFPPLEADSDFRLGVPLELLLVGFPFALDLASCDGFDD